MRSSYFSRRTILIFALGVAACFAIWNFLIRPAELRVTENEGTYQTRLGQTERLRAELASLQSGQSNEIEEAYQEARLLDGILLPGAGTQMREYLLEYMPRLPSHLGFDAPDSSVSVPPKTEGDTEYLEYSYTITGSLPQIYSFLTSLNQLPLLTTVETFSVSTSSGAPDEWAAPISVRVWWGAFAALPDFTFPSFDVNIPQAPPSPPTTIPSTPDPSTILPAETQPDDSQPADSQPGESQPGESQPGESQPGESQPGDS